MNPDGAGVTVLACGALARELVALRRLNGWAGMRITCLPAKLHQTPERIAGAVREKITQLQAQSGDDILVAYGDCGTAGALDRVLAETGASRLPGAHCYEFYAGAARFAELQDAEPGTFYLTDFLVTHFDAYVWRALGLDRHPDIRDMVFCHYRRLVYLAQTSDAALDSKAVDCAKRLGLAYQRIDAGYGEMAGELHRKVASFQPMATSSPAQRVSASWPPSP